MTKRSKCLVLMAVLPFAAIATPLIDEALSAPEGLYGKGDHPIEKPEYRLIVKTTPMNQAEMRLAGVDPSYFERSGVITVEQSSSTDSNATQSLSAAPGGGSSTSANSLAGNTTMSSSDAAFTVRTRQYTGRLDCSPACSVDPDEFRNTFVSANAENGATLIDIVMEIMPSNWTILADDIELSALQQEFVAVITSTRYAALNELSEASGIQFKPIYDRMKDGRVQPLLILAPEEF